MDEKLLTVEETFEVLQAHGLINNIEVVRRWLRQGKLQGIAPGDNKKRGWRVEQSALDSFVADRLAANKKESEINTTQLESVALNETAIRADERAVIWHEITSKNIWEGYVEVKKNMLKEVAEHRGYSQQLVNEVWERCVANSSAYKQPRVSYLLDAFSFEGERILMDHTFSSKAEQIIYAIFEHVKSNSKRLK